eukprot:CAMPEP_0194217210 /NCGR_PEP_ID=MMETSP0156-20130528/20654_1 /TAXON_ID=33649 /ORGANISM="Thalassionema nitzschioides, Strain L26-B" /LENGTH=119 /DNA_ID=CAMNT_0038946189 /DNA_START=110 /DNA_END=469 /DNA_ORIENTATION=-
MILSAKSGSDGNNGYLADITYNTEDIPPLASVAILQFHPPNLTGQILFDVVTVKDDNFWNGRERGGGFGSANFLQSTVGAFAGSITGSLTTHNFVYQLGPDGDGNLRLRFQESGSFPED